MKRFAKGSTEQVSDHFEANEFDCPCEECTETEMNLDLIGGLERMRRALGVPVTVTSAYRCQAYQEDLERRGFETAKNSQHLKGCAVDLWTGKHTGDQLEAVARGCGFQAVGVGSDWIHIDCRVDRDRRWTYKKRKT